MIRLSDFCGGTPGAAGQCAGMPQIAINGNGNALVVWTQPDGVSESI
jgi:hypothetical protein